MDLLSTCGKPYAMGMTLLSQHESDEVNKKLKYSL